MTSRQFQLTVQQIDELLRAYESCDDCPTRVRYQAVRLYGIGHPVAGIKTLTGCSRTSLMEWCKANLWTVKDLQLIKYRRQQGQYADARRPNLNLPRKDGREVLAEIKSDPDLQRIPVVILTTSQAEEDIPRTYNLHANCCVTKPVDLDQFIRVVKSIEEFWFTIVRLPSE